MRFTAINDEAYNLLATLQFVRLNPYNRFNFYWVSKIWPLPRAWMNNLQRCQSICFAARWCSVKNLYLIKIAFSRIFWREHLAEIANLRIINHYFMMLMFSRPSIGNECFSVVRWWTSDVFLMPPVRCPETTNEQVRRLVSGARRVLAWPPMRKYAYSCTAV